MPTFQMKRTEMRLTDSYSLVDDAVQTANESISPKLK